MTVYIRKEETLPLSTVSFLRQTFTVSHMKPFESHLTVSKVGLELPSSLKSGFLWALILSILGLQVESLHWQHMWPASAMQVLEEDQ